MTSFERVMRIIHDEEEDHWILGGLVTRDGKPCSKEVYAFEMDGVIRLSVDKYAFSALWVMNKTGPSYEVFQKRLNKLNLAPESLFVPYQFCAACLGISEKDVARMEGVSNLAHYLVEYIDADHLLGAPRNRKDSRWRLWAEMNHWLAMEIKRRAKGSLAENLTKELDRQKN